MENKQTAVEWLVEQLKEYDFAHIKDNENYIIKLPAWVLAEKQQQAKAMERQQISDGYLLGAYVEQQNNAEELQDKLTETLEFSKKYPEGTPAETIVDDYLDMYKTEDNGK